MKQQCTRRSGKAITSIVREKKVKRLNMRSAACQLKIGFKTLFKLLQENGHFIKTDRYNVPKPELIEKGYFVNELKDFKRGTITGQYIKTYVTPSGMSFLAEMIQINQKGVNDG